MAIRYQCDQCGDLVPEAMREMHNVILEKSAAGKPERKMHVQITHLLPHNHEKAHICARCSVANLERVIVDLTAIAVGAAPKPAPAKESPAKEPKK